MSYRDIFISLATILFSVELIGRIIKRIGLKSDWNLQTMMREMNLLSSNPQRNTSSKMDNNKRNRYNNSRSKLMNIKRSVMQ